MRPVAEQPLDNDDDDTCTSGVTYDDFAFVPAPYDEDDDDDDGHHNQEGRGSIATSSSHNDNNEDKDNADEEQQLASAESKLVHRFRRFMVYVIVVASISVAAGVYMLTKNRERYEFHQQFNVAALLAVSTFENIVDQKLPALASLALQTSVYANTASTTWPFVTIPTFHQHAAVARRLSHALVTRLVPLVTAESRDAWEEYSVQNTWWLDVEPFPGFVVGSSDGRGGDDGRRLVVERATTTSSRNVFRTELVGNDDPTEALDGSDLDYSSGVASGIWEYNDTVGAPIMRPQENTMYFPLWQESPIFYGQGVTNWDMLTYPPYRDFFRTCFETKNMVLGSMQTAPTGGVDSPYLATSYFSYLLGIEYDGRPMSSIFVPVLEDFEAQGENRTVVAVILAVLDWTAFFENLLPPHFPGLDVILHNDCDQQSSFTYRIRGDVTAVESGDRHDSRYDGRLEHRAALGGIVASAPDQALFGMTLNQDHCRYEIMVYPSKALEDSYLTLLPLAGAMGILFVFACTAAVFSSFSIVVERRQKVVLKQAVRSTALVTSLFPEEVRDRLINDANSNMLLLSGKSRLQNYLSSDDVTQTQNKHSAPIADLFPFCTVFFGDIAGFTAYSSTREPCQVFILLETIYQAFDMLAKQRGVFKVETIGDTYLAVTGLPKPNPHHAVFMARFPMDCLKKFKKLTKQLENTLGPDTSELGLRIGLHSGPVTAGVLRGERSRFQLFGDTVNTAARMESTGCANRIQISQTTAELLRAEGKDNWIADRSDAVHAKGKGVLATFWLQPKHKRSYSSRSTTSEATAATAETLLRSHPNQFVMNHKTERLVNWVVDTCSKHLAKIIALRGHEPDPNTSKESLIYKLEPGKTSLDEVVEVIKMPTFNNRSSSVRAKDRSLVAVDDVVASQLNEVICRIAALYNINPFHNFEHACHVTMAVDKFLSRIETPDLTTTTTSTGDDTIDAHHLASQIHDFTHGITSDPTTVLAIVFAALVHDADHRGVSNAQLAQEDVSMAQLYHNQSIAEQHSLDESWRILMDDEYHELRLAMFGGERTEMLRFRQVFVNVVLATDIFDKQLNDLRKNRWNKAFNIMTTANGNDDGNDGDDHTGHGIEIDSNLRATIVMEHIIQASDVAHTMQHWHIYRKWNERLFEEMHEAFLCGRMAKNPADFWYHGELAFFDNYVIPLARKLQECNVFGVSSDECLDYALANRAEWAHKGDEVVASLIELVKGNNNTRIGQKS